MRQVEVEEDILRAHPLVEYVEPSLPVYPLRSQDTTWAVHSIQAPPEWDSTTGAAMVVALVDTGIEGSHSDLNPASLHSCIQSSGTDIHGHGTEVAGMIAAQASSSGIAGAAHGWWQFLTVEPDRRIEIDDGFADEEGREQTEMPTTRMVLTFETTDEGSRMTMRSHFPDQRSMEKLLGMGMDEGLRSAIGQLDSVLAR